jgi:hypothetical protein
VTVNSVIWASRSSREANRTGQPTDAYDTASLVHLTDYQK